MEKIPISYIDEPEAMNSLSHINNQRPSCDASSLWALCDESYTSADLTDF